MPPRRKAAGDAEARVKNIASKEAASRAEMAAAQALKAAQNPAALAPPPPTPPALSQEATKPNLIEQVKQKNKAAPAKAQSKTPQNRTVTGRVQKSKKETPAEARRSASQQPPQKNAPQASRTPSINKPQPVRKPSAPQQSLQGGSVPSSAASSVNKPQPLGRSSASQPSSQGGSSQSNATSKSKPQAVRRPSGLQQNVPDEPSPSLRPASTSGQPTRRPSTSQQIPQSGPVSTPRTPQPNGHQGSTHPTLSTPGKASSFWNPLSNHNGMATSPVSPSMGSAVRRSSMSMFGQPGGQRSALSSQFAMGQPPQMSQSPNPAQLYRRSSFGPPDDGSGWGQLKQGMQSPLNRCFSRGSPQNGYGTQTVQGRSLHPDEFLRRQLFGGYSNDGSTQLQMQQMMVPQPSHMRRHSHQNDYGMQAGQSQSRSPSFQSVQQGQHEQFQGFQGQGRFYQADQQRGMQPQHLATLSYQSQRQQIESISQQQQSHHPNPDNGTRPGNQARHSPSMPPPPVSRQINSVSGGLERLQVDTSPRLLNSQGKEDESSASTQASPERPYDNLKGPSPSKAQLSQNPQAKLVNRRGSASLSSARPTLNRTPSSLSRSISALDNDEDLEMGGMVEDGATEHHPTPMSQVAEPIQLSPNESPIVPEANPSGSKQAPKKFTKNDSITSVNKNSKEGQFQGSSPEPEANTSPSTTTMRGIVPPTPKKWTNLPLPSFPKSSPPALLPSRSDINQTEPINEIDTLLVASLIANNKNRIDSGSQISAEEYLRSSPIPRSATNNSEFDILIQDPIGARLVPRAQIPAAEASPKKSVAAQLLEQRHEDGLAGFTDYSQEDTRRDGVAAKLLASLASSVNNRSAPRVANTQTRCPVAVDFKDLAIGQLKRTKEYPGNQFNTCSFCNHEEDCGLGPSEFLLPPEAFGFTCADCQQSQLHFTYACYGTDPNIDNVMTKEQVTELQLHALRNPTLQEAYESAGGKEMAETYWRAKKLPRNTRSVHDGNDISRFRGIMTCRGSPYGQLDITKPQICRMCLGDKFAIIIHDKHAAFIADSDKTARFERPEFEPPRRCMVCINIGSNKCAECPLRLCDSCKIMLSTMCKGYLDNLLYLRERAGAGHIRNDMLAGFDRHSAVWGSDGVKILGLAAHAWS